MDRKKNRYLIISIVGIEIVLLLILCEFLLRILPIPGVQLTPKLYIDVTGRGLYANSTAILRNNRGETIVKKTNKWRFFDIDHERGKEKGVYRIGFFGDSYTEAAQVPNEDTFFRVIGDSLRNYNVETIAFGYGGLGTIHSYLLCKNEMNKFDLDLIVYVFVENDIGDNIREIKRDPNMPHAASKKWQFDY